MRFSLAAMLLFASAAMAEDIPAPAPAQGDWVHVSGDTYKGSSYYWRAYYVPCCGWKYQRLQPVVIVPAVTAPDFYELALRSLTQAESEAEKRAFLESRFPANAVHAAGYQTTTGVNVMQQGVLAPYATGGTTLYGTAAYQSVAAIDVNSLIHESQRLVDRTLGLASEANAGAANLVSQAVDGNTKAAQIFAGGQAAAAAISAANPPTTQVQAYQTQSGNAVNPPQQQAPPPPPPPQMQPNTADQGSVNSALYGRIALASCTSCHSGPAPKGSLDLSLAAIASLGPAERAELAGRVANRIDPAADPDKRMPRGKPPLAQKMHDGLLAVLSH